MSKTTQSISIKMYYVLFTKILRGGGDTASRTVLQKNHEIMQNQITFMFSKECHGNILSMHLAKFHKLEKWHSFCCFVLYKTKQLILLSFLWSSKNIKTYPLRNLKYVNENYKYRSSAIIFQINWPVYLRHQDLKKNILSSYEKKNSEYAGN